MSDAGFALGGADTRREALIQGNSDDQDTSVSAQTPLEPRGPKKYKLRMQNFTDGYDEGVFRFVRRDGKVHYFYELMNRETKKAEHRIFLTRQEAFREDVILLARSRIPKDHNDVATEAGPFMSLVKPITVTLLLTAFIVWELTKVRARQGSLFVVVTPSAGSSTGAQIGGALLNALIFVGVMIVMTCLILLLYKFQCMKAMYSIFVVIFLINLGFFGGFTWYQLWAPNVYNLPLDWITFIFVLWNFASVGVMVIFWRGPRLATQTYLVLLSSLMSSTLVMTLPEWTTWALLALVAVWDIIAVLMPKGPLQMLVKAAAKNAEDEEKRKREARASQAESQTADDGGTTDRSKTATSTTSSTTPTTYDEEEGEEEASAVRYSTPSSPRYEYDEEYYLTDDDGGDSRSSESYHQVVTNDDDNSAGEHPHELEDSDDEEEEKRPDIKIPGLIYSARKVKLGLGDFIFYSILIAQAAAVHDITTLIACIIAVIMGLCGTLILLALMQRVLPALPLSIFLGIIFFLITRLLILPFAVQLADSQFFV